MIKMGFLFYSVTNRGGLDSYYIENTFPNKPFIARPNNMNDDVLQTILTDLELDINSPRLTFLGTFNLKGLVETEEELDVMAIDISSMNMKLIEEKWNVIHQPAYMLNREENALTLAIIMKLLLVKKKMANEKEKVIEIPKDEEYEVTLDEE